MGGQLPRKPMELFQHRRHGCVTTVTGQVLYVFGRTNKPDLAAIDRAADLRSPDVELYDSDAHFYLLRLGFKLVVIGEFNLERFLREGKQYLREVDPDWTQEHEAFFTPAKVREIQRANLANRARLQPYLKSGAVRDLNRRPTKKDVAALLSRGYAVDATFDNGERNKKRVQHAVLLVPVKHTSGGGVTVWAYYPDMPGSDMPVVYQLSLKEALKWVRYDRSVVGIKY